MPRFRRLRIYRYFRPFLAIFVLYNILEVLYIQTTQLHSPPISSPQNTRVYIASIHWNNEAILRNYWNKAVVDLVKALGPENVFVSVYESGSWDDSKGALRLLDQTLGDLGVRRNITLSETTHLDEISQSPIGPGWIDTSRGRKELRRIPYLSRLRNYTLWNLGQLFQQGILFDKVIFLNDVIFTVGCSSYRGLLLTYCISRPMIFSPY
jgi:hypothetical protein